MDAQGIAAAVQSVSGPGVHFGNDAEAREFARASNDALAEVVRRRPSLRLLRGAPATRR
jgi:hypothetical protein